MCLNNFTQILLFKNFTALMSPTVYGNNNNNKYYAYYNN